MLKSFNIFAITVTLCRMLCGRGSQKDADFLHSVLTAHVFDVHDSTALPLQTISDDLKILS